MSERKPSIFSLPQEILAHIFNSLPVKLWYPNDWDRCRVIPLVCKEFCRIQSLYPPRQGSFMLYETPTNAHIKSLTWIADSVETVVLWDGKRCLTDAGEGQAFMELLQAVAACPNLCKADITTGHSCPGLARGFGSLTQIQHLSLHHWVFSGKMPSDLAQLSKLQRLKSIQMHNPNWEQATQEEVDVLWGSLASLAGLTLVDFGREFEENYYARTVGPGMLASFCHSISRLTQIRDLTLGGIDDFLDPNRLLSGGLTPLTNLTALALMCALPSLVISHMGVLPELQVLSLVVDDTGRDPASLFAAAGALTSLTIRGLPERETGGQLPAAPLRVSRLLPPAVLPRLNTLELLDAQLNEFPEAVAAALVNLVSLDLSHNRFWCLPAIISRLTTLECLRLAANSPLGLEEKDLGILRSLPNLKVFDISKIPDDPEEDYDDVEDFVLYKWRREDMPIMFRMWKDFPQLDMPMTFRRPANGLLSRWLE